MTAVVANFANGNGTSSADQYTGKAGDGWWAGWFVSGSNTSTSAGVVNTSPLNGGGNYVAATMTATGGSSRGGISRAYNTMGNVDVTGLHQIQLDFRLDSDLSTFTSTNDQVYVFGDGGYNFAPLTSDTLLAEALGGAVTGLSAKHWGVFDGDGSGGGSRVDTGITLTQSTVYHFTFLVDSANHRYQAYITDGTAGTGHTYQSGWLGWDYNDTFTTRAYLNIGSRRSATGEATSFSFDSVKVTPPPPNAPSSLTGSLDSTYPTSTINLSWTDNSSTETGSTVEYSQSSSFSSVQTVSVGSNVTSTPVASLTSGTTYYFRVKSTNEGGESSYSNTFNITTASSGPTVTTPAAASPSTVTGTTSALSVLGAYSGGESSLTYTWSAIAKPTGASDPTYSANGTNAAKNTTVTFSKAGSYTLRATVSNGSQTATSDLSVTVNQTLTTITVTPANPTANLNGTQQFSASAIDQFGNTLSSQPSFSWSVSSGGGSINSSGLYTAPATTGSYTVTATGGSISGNTGITVSNAAPTVATAASGTPSPVTGTTSNLSVLGADDGGEANLTYTWSVVSKPWGASDPTFSANGTHAAKSTVATFTKTGSYTIRSTISDGTLTTTSDVSLTVNQTLSSIVVSPAPPTLSLNSTQQFTATANDQFGTALSTQPSSYTWAVTSGGGSINSTGLYTASSTAGGATVSASSGSVSGTVGITVNDTGPTLATAASATPGTVSASSTNLSVRGADDGGESNLTYTWSITSKPSGATDPTFSANRTHGARDTTAAFSKAGSYTFRATISDGSHNITSDVNVLVNQTLTSIAVTPATPSVAAGGTQLFTATAADQFGNTLTTPPTFTWSVGSGGGSVNSSGLLTAGSNAGSYTVTATSGSVSGSTTFSTITAPVAPTNLTATPVSPARVDLTWTDNSNNETGFKIERKIEAWGDWTQIDAVGANVTSYSDTTADEGTHYYYRVRATNMAGDSDYSNEQDVTTPSWLNASSQDFSTTAGQTYNGTVATFTSADLMADSSSFIASIDWGDGVTSSGSVTETGTGSFTVNGVHQFLAPDVSQVLVTISDGHSEPAVALSDATVADAAPTVATAASAVVSDDGTYVNLDVFGADYAGEDDLMYTWSATNGSGDVVFDTNGNHSAQTTFAVLSAAGDYTFQVTIANSLGESVSSSVDVAVDPIFTSINVTPASQGVEEGNTLQLTGTALDQFGTAMDDSPTFTWAVSEGPGTIDSWGMYTAPDRENGPVTVTASYEGMTGTGDFNVTTSGEFTATAVSPTEIDLTWPTPAAGTQTELEWKGPGDTNYHTFNGQISGGDGSQDHPLALTNLVAGSSYQFRLQTTDSGTVTYVESDATTQGTSNSPYGPSLQVQFSYRELTKADFGFTDLSEDPSRPGYSESVNSAFTALVDFANGLRSATLSYIYEDGYADWWDGTVIGPEYQIAYQNPDQHTYWAADVYGLGSLDPSMMYISFAVAFAYGPFSTPHLAWAEGPQPMFSMSKTTDDYHFAGDGDSELEIIQPTASDHQPAAPTSLTATPVADSSGNSARLAWSNTPDNEDGFVIERSTDGGQHYTAIDSVDADETSYVDADSPAGVTCTYRVGSTGGDSPAYSSTAWTSFPGAPTNLTATADDEDGVVNLSWNDPSGGLEDGFEIQWSNDGENFIQLATTTGTSTQFIDSIPQSAVNYYRIVAYRNTTIDDSTWLESAPSNVASDEPVAPPIAIDDDNAGYLFENTVDPYLTPVNQVLTVDNADGVLANDFDPGSQSLSIASYTQPQHGTVTVNTQGGFTYTPANGYAGQDAFTYVISNGILSSTPATVAVLVAKAPVHANPDYYQTDTDGHLTMTANSTGSLGSNDDNADHVAVTYSLLEGAGPQHGTLTLQSDGSFTYTATSGYTGLDHFRYVVHDGNTASNVATVVIASHNSTYTPPGASSSVPGTLTVDSRYPGRLKKVVTAYNAAIARLKQVYVAVSDLGSVNQQIATSDPADEAVSHLLDMGIAQFDTLNRFYDYYVSQVHAVLDLAGEYMKFNPDAGWRVDDANILNKVTALPITVSGIEASREQILKISKGLNNFAAGTEWMIVQRQFTVQSAQLTHDALNRVIRDLGPLAVMEAGIDLLVEKGCAEFACHAFAAAVQITAVDVLNRYAAQHLPQLASEYHISEDALRIGFDGLQVWGLVKAAREQQQARSTCFVAGTEVLTGSNNGVFSEKPIEQVQVGDEVLTRNQNDPNAPLEQRRVTQVFQHTAYNLSDMTIQGANGHMETIRATTEHPFYVEGLGWTEASHLVAGEHLLQADGSEAVVFTNATEVHPEGVTVYNFTVDDDHTYFVSAEGQVDVSIWVHNDCERPVARPGMAERTVTDTEGNAVSIYGQSSSSSTTPGHDAAIEELAERLAKSGEAKYVTMQRSWGTATNRVSGSRSIPDVLAVNRDGTVDAFEIASQTDDLAVLRQRLEDGLKSLPSAMRGKVKVIVIQH